MKTIGDMVKDTKEEELRLDLYFYERELAKTSNSTEKDTISKKIKTTERLLLELRN